MKGLKNLNLVGKIGLGLCLICLIFYVVAFCTNYWHVTTERPVGSVAETHRNDGLWYVCSSGRCVARGQRLATGVDQATQAMESVGLALTIVGLAMFVVKLLFESMEDLPLGLISIICLLGAVLFYLIGLIMWGVYYRPPIRAWSYVVAHLTTLLQIPASVLLMMGSRN